MAEKVIQWSAKEHVTQERNVGWYFGLFGVAAVLVALAVWQQQWTFIALIVVSVVALLVYVLRPPRELEYTLDDKGITESGKFFGYDSFKSFGVLQEGEVYSIVLIPRKRFSPRVTVYFPKEKGEEIVDAFGARLPMEEAKADLLDKLVKFLRI